MDIEDHLNSDYRQDVEMGFGLGIARKLDFNQVDCHSLSFVHETLNESNVPMENKSNKDEIPKLDMEFESLDHAYEFYNRYAGRIGFSVRKGHGTRSKNGVVRVKEYCCSAAGHRQKDKRRTDVKKPRPDSRHDCKACMVVTLQTSGEYRVTRFEVEHTHLTVTPRKTNMLRSQKKFISSQADFPNNFGITPKVAYEFKGGQVEGCQDLGLDYRNYLHSKRKIAMRKGDVGAIMDYFEMMQLENPSFFHSIQFDEDDYITNIFWADARSVVDYGHFGDVVCFDTTYRTNNNGRPFALFVGVNHHRQTVIFGAALLYDETVESYKWVFETFIKVMFGKKPKTILTDQCQAMADAIALVLPEAHHRLCLWHIYQNATMHLSHVFGASSSFEFDFKSCIYNHEEEDDFLMAWDGMLEKYNIKENSWLKHLFEVREKWALSRGRQAFCADMITTRRSECINSVLRHYLNSENDLLRFLQHFERMLEDRRYDELQADFKMCQTKTRLYANVQMLRHAASVYTLEVFKMFENEYIQVLDCIVHNCVEIETITKYKVAMYGKSHEYTITFDSLDDTVLCSCRKFEFIGILCTHALKILDLRNVKEIPPRYIMKRWTKEAKTRNILDNRGSTIQLEPKVDVARRYKELCGELVRIAARAAESEETYRIVASYSAKISREVEEIKKRITLEEPPNAETVSVEDMHVDSTTSTKGRGGKEATSNGLCRKP